jgi:hypothetical protein
VSPERCERFSATNYAAVGFLGVKSLQKQQRVQRTRFSGIDVDKIDAVKPIETPHDRHFSGAKGATAIKPNGNASVCSRHKYRQANNVAES